MASVRPKSFAGPLSHLCKCVPCNEEFRSATEATDHFGSEQHKEVVEKLTSAGGKTPPVERIIRTPERDRPLTEEEAMIRQRMMQPLIVCEENIDFSSFVIKHNLFTWRKHERAASSDVNRVEGSHQ